MDVSLWIVVGLGSWFVASVPAGLLVGRALARYAGVR
jgi:hypothetical protein